MGGSGCSRWYRAKRGALALAASAATTAARPAAAVGSVVGLAVGFASRQTPRGAPQGAAPPPPGTAAARGPRRCPGGGLWAVGGAPGSLALEVQGGRAGKGRPPR